MMTLSRSRPNTLHPGSGKNSVKQAMELMQQERIRHIPIVDEHQHLLGLVTPPTSCHQGIQAAADQPGAGEAEFTDSVQLTEIMTRQVASVDPHAGIKEAGLYPQRHKYGCLPVPRGAS